MGFGVMEDKYDSIEVALYGATYEKYKTLFGADAFVVIKGNVVESRDGYKINIREIINPRNDEKQKNEQVTEQTTTTTLWLKMESRDDEVYGQDKGRSRPVRRRYTRKNQNRRQSLRNGNDRSQMQRYRIRAELAFG